MTQRPRKWELSPSNQQCAQKSRGRLSAAASFRSNKPYRWGVLSPLDDKEFENLEPRDAGLIDWWDGRRDSAPRSHGCNKTLQFVPTLSFSKSEPAMDRLSLPAAIAFLSSMLLVNSTTYGVIVLPDGGYTQDFNSIGAGLPAGITVRTGATASILGTVQTFNQSMSTWGTTTGAFANFASSTGLASSATTAQQNGSVDRAVGLRQTGAFGDPGASYTFQFQDTLGYEDFAMSFSAELLSNQPRSSTWTVQYGLGATPTFTTLGTFIPSAYGSTTYSYDLPTSLDDQSLALWIRVIALSASTGSGNRDTFGVDDFSLNYSTIVAVPEPSPALFAALLAGAFGLMVARRPADRD